MNASRENAPRKWEDEEMSRALSVCHGGFGRAALYELDSTFVTHAHREGHLIFYIDGGPAHVPVGNIVIKLDATTAVAVSPWEPHSFHLETPGESCLCLVLYIKPTWFPRASQCAEFALNFGRARIRVSDDISCWVQRLTNLLVDQELSDSFDSALLEITRRSYDQSWAGIGGNDGMFSVRARYSDHRIRRSLKLMRGGFTEDMSIKMVAREAGLSHQHFFQLFKRYIGVTPNVYWNALRAEQAIEDLLTTEKSVTDIGYKIGFSSQASFTRFFTSNVGIPPSEYRRRAYIH